MIGDEDNDDTLTVISFISSSYLWFYYQLLICKHWNFNKYLSFLNQRNTASTRWCIIIICKRSNINVFQRPSQIINTCLVSYFKWLNLNVIMHRISEKVKLTEYSEAGYTKNIFSILQKTRDKNFRVIFNLKRWSLSSFPVTKERLQWAWSSGQVHVSFHGNQLHIFLLSRLQKQSRNHLNYI